MNKDTRKLWEVWGQTNALYTQWCAAQNVNYYRQLVLYALEAHAPTTQKKIADDTGLSKQTVATVMRALKTEGLVDLSAGSGDRREKTVRLTEAGTEYAKNALGSLHALEDRVFEILGEDRIRQMLDAVSLFNTVFQKEMEAAHDAGQK